MSKLHIKTGDIVKVLTGKDKGKSGKVIQVFPKLNRVVVEGVNASKRHLKNRGGSSDKGQVIDFNMPIHASNVALTDGSAAPVKKPAAKRVTKKA